MEELTQCTKCKETISYLYDSKFDDIVVGQSKCKCHTVKRINGMKLLDYGLMEIDKAIKENKFSIIKENY